MDLHQQLASGIANHQAGRLKEAEGMYQQILRQQPNHAETLHMLGVLYGQTGRFQTAVGLIRRAISICPANPAFFCNLSNALTSIGKFDEAVGSCREAIRLKPEYAEAYCNLGGALMALGRSNEAIASFRQAIRIAPDLAEGHNNLGNALFATGQIDEPIEFFQTAVRLKPKYADAYFNLGNALNIRGQQEDAIDAYRQTIRCDPRHAQAHNNLGNILTAQKNIHNAIACYRQAIQLVPRYADAHYNLGNALKEKNRVDEAMVAYRHAIRINPHCAEAHGNLGNLLRGAGRLDEATACYREAIRAKPTFAEAYFNLGIALERQLRLDESIAAYEQAIQLKPDYADALTNLGSILRSIGQIDEAVSSFRKAMEYKPRLLEAHKNLLFAIQFHPAYDPEMILAEHQRWNLLFAEPLQKFIKPHLNTRDPDRRLKVGYISPDFREHCQSFFTVPLFSNHDHQNFEIFCYSDVRTPDAATEKLRGYVDHWHSIVGMSDSEVAKKIGADGIDILVDLTMHMAEGRLLALARKPAPVQVSWLAYPGTTGLSAIDYRLTDPLLDPPQVSDRFYSEKSIRLPDTFWCYDPLVTDLPVNPLPALIHGHITFGCLNNFCKVNREVLRLWARVLCNVDKSRLIMLCPTGQHRQRVLKQLQNEGIDSDRVEMIAYQPRMEYLKLYHRIDLGLDTFPYNGHTTSLDSYWMGVPVVSLVGTTVVGRAGLSQLTNLGLPQLLARTTDQYVQIAADVAGNLKDLAELRRTLRQHMQVSPLMNGARLARNIETAYRQMWFKWCGEGR